MTAAGVATLVHRRRTRSPLGETRQKHLKHGRTVTHIRDRAMPIEQRVAIIQDLVWQGINGPDLPELRKIALEITRHCPERDGRCEARAIYDYVKKHVRYTGDIAPIKMGSTGPVESVDLFQSALRTLEYMGGDCDDHTILTSSLLALNGIQPKLRVTAPTPTGDDGHIYTMAGVDTKMTPTAWIAVDTTLPGSNWFAKEAPYGRARDFTGARRRADYAA